MNNQYCVYRFLNSDDEIIYIGKTNSIYTRMNTHFMTNYSDKYKETVKVEFMNVEDNEEAELCEFSLIRKYRPKYNITFNKDKEYDKETKEYKEEWKAFCMSNYSSMHPNLTLYPPSENNFIKYTDEWWNVIIDDIDNGVCIHDLYLKYNMEYDIFSKIKYKTENKKHAYSLYVLKNDMKRCRMSFNDYPQLNNFYTYVNVSLILKSLKFKLNNYTYSRYGLKYTCKLDKNKYDKLVKQIKEYTSLLEEFLTEFYKTDSSNNYYWYETKFLMNDIISLVKDFKLAYLTKRFKKYENLYGEITEAI